MSITVRTAMNAPKDLSEIVVRDENNVPRNITEIWVRDETSTLKQVWGGTAGGGTGALSATLFPDSVQGAVSRPSPTSARTNDVTVQVTGGVPPYTYAWSASSSLTATNPTSATTAFFGTVGPGEELSDSFNCTVTDAIGANTDTGFVGASVSNYWNAP